jgi:hypothetical protein
MEIPKLFLYYIDRRETFRLQFAQVEIGHATAHLKEAVPSDATARTLNG